MKNFCDGAVMSAAFVAMVVKLPFALNTLVATGVHWFNGSATLLLVSVK